jgi:hypothetical protein
MTSTRRKPSPVDRTRPQAARPSEEPMPPRGSRSPALHVLERQGKLSIVRWSVGKWVFHLGHDPDRRSPAEALEHGWSYRGPAIMLEGGGAAVSEEDAERMRTYLRDRGRSA